MNKTELISKVSETAGYSKKEVNGVIQALMSSIISEVAKGDKVQLVGFGTFASVKRSARKGRNPQSGKAINIPAKKAPKFRAGKAFKSAVK
ncbi:MAG: HU family DNA-binding protein [Candidatus Parvarchaeota archaeon]|nr:HU family DNA-binding protein [Candidatus Jingweiarchaeum tengchongense]MCW1306073.1 HU family DNA-binding protein [Candidatus Jingweiarchaeum tengchongense]